MEAIQEKLGIIYKFRINYLRQKSTFDIFLAVLSKTSINVLPIIFLFFSGSETFFKFLISKLLIFFYEKKFSSKKYGVLRILFNLTPHFKYIFIFFFPIDKNP